MATAEQYGAWIVANKDKRGTPEFEKVAAAYKLARGAEQPKAPEAKTAGDVSLGEYLKHEMQQTPLYGAMRGIKDVIDTGAEYLAKGYDKFAGSNESGRVKAENDAGKADFERTSSNSTGASVGRVTGNVLATLPVGGVIGNTVKALSTAPRVQALGNAISTAGFRTGGPSGIVNMLTRTTGGAVTGGASAGLVDPEEWKTGALVGGTLPFGLAAIGKSANVLGGLVKPFYKGGQDAIKGSALREFATNPQNALANLRNTQEIIPGSVPTAVMAAGDEGLAGLSRTIQSQSGQYAGELSARQAAQNAARTSAIESVAGNTGKIKLAEEARDAATSAMRESVLSSAGKVPASPVLSSIDNLIKQPDNAGKLSQQALNEFRSRIAQFAPDGQIDARALYAIRKDINDVLGGKLQGEAGNIRYASSQLIKVKSLIDDAIDKASRVVKQSESRAVMPVGPNVRAGAAPNINPRPTWSQYLQEYSERSKPIEQMKVLDDVLKRIQTGSVDKSGNAVLSAAKLNNLLKNDGKELLKTLSTEQLDLLRRLSADLNASQLASNAGRAVGSNTVQNLSQSGLLKEVLGKTVGGGTVATSTLGRLLQLPYGTANQQIMEGLGNALLDPKEMTRLLQTPQGNKLLQALSERAQIGYKAAPVISSQ
jgi:hypothetical protein